MNSSCAGLTRASIHLRKSLVKKMDRRIKSGDDASLLSSARLGNPIWTCRESSLTLWQSRNADPDVDRQNARIREEANEHDPPRCFRDCRGRGGRDRPATTRWCAVF
jgi:hypothetical protein